MFEKFDINEIITIFASVKNKTRNKIRTEAQGAGSSVKTKELVNRIIDNKSKNKGFNLKLKFKNKFN